MSYKETDEEIQLDIKFEKLVNTCQSYPHEKERVKDVLSYMRESVSAAFAFSEIDEKILEDLLSAIIHRHHDTALSIEILNVLKADILRTFIAINLRTYSRVILMEMQPQCIEMVKYIFGFDAYDTWGSKFEYLVKESKYSVAVMGYSIGDYVRFVREYTTKEKGKFDKIILLLNKEAVNDTVKKFPQLLVILNRFRIHNRFNQKINQCNMIDGDRLEKNILHDQWLFEKICRLEI